MMFGLAIMAAKLANQRCGYDGAAVLAMRMLSSRIILSGEVVRHCGFEWQLTVVDRLSCFDGTFKASREYYKICDRITRGEKP